MGYKPDWQNGSMKKPAGHKCSPGTQSRELFHGAKMADGGILKGYADGGMPEPLREPTEADRGETSMADMPALREPTAADRGETSAPKNFGAAFKDARASGAKEFEYQGKKYNTKLKEEAKSTPAPSTTTKATSTTSKGFDVEDGSFNKPSKGEEAGYKVDAARAEYKASRDTAPGLSKGRAAIDANKADQATKKAAVKKAQADYETELGDAAKPYVGYRRK